MPMNMCQFNAGRLTLLVTGWLAILTACAGAAPGRVDAVARDYAFIFLGDMHFDRVSHHDMEWVRAEKPNDVRQIEDYVRVTEQHTPRLLERIQTRIASSDTRIEMVVQGGDLVEGLCGSRALQEQQFRDTLDCVRQHLPETRFLVTKGNHDITGPGAREAFNAVMLPWLSTQCGRKAESASFCFKHGPDLFVFFDAYHANDPGWLERALRGNPHRYAFVVMHPPAVPYTARSTWHLFSRDEERERRAEFLNVLGAHRVILLTAHLHKYSVLARTTPDGRFVQVGMNSVLDAPSVSARHALRGADTYGGSLLALEPAFQPETRARRLRILNEEKPWITHFEYAEFPGYAILRVSEEGVEMTSYLGASGEAWNTLSLSALLEQEERLE